MIPHNRAQLADKDGRPTRDWYDWFRRLGEVFEPLGGATGLLATKQDKLVSGGNLKTINGESLLGSEDIVISTSLSDNQASLNSDVQLVASSAWYDGPSVTLTSGYWMVIATASFSRSTATATRWEAKIEDGTTTYASSNAFTPAVANATASITLNAFVLVVGSSTITLQATTNAGAAACLMRSTTFDSGNPYATKIIAVKIS